MSVSVPDGVRDDERARRWLVGTELELYRNVHDVKQSVLAELLDVSQSMVSKYLRGVHMPEPDQVLMMLDACGVAAEVAQPLADFASWPTGGTSWLAPWEKLIAAHNRIFIGIEGLASGIFRYGQQVVPALLQVPAYTRGMTISSMRVPKDQHSPRLALQQARQQRVLDGHLHVITAIEEHVLDRPPSSDPDDMDAQLEHLLEMDEKGFATIRVLETALGYHEGLDGGRFAVATLENEPGVRVAGPVAFVELRDKAEYIVARDAVQGYLDVQEALMDAALDRNKSMDAIRKRLTRKRLTA